MEVDINAFKTRKFIGNATINLVLTAMSGLSASTYSWGGEGSRFGRGGDASTLDSELGRGALEKNFRIPSFLVNWRLVSSSDGTEDRSEESSELMLLVFIKEGFGGKEKCEVRASSRYLPTVR